MAEAGLPGYEVVTWYGILAPGGMSRDLAMRINREIVRVLKLPDVREKFSSQGVELVGGSQDEFAAYLRAESGKWAKVIKDSGTQLQ